MNLQATVSFLTVVFLSSLAVPTDADVGSRDLRGERAVKKWNKELNQIDRLILDGEPEQALVRGDRLMKKIVGQSASAVAGKGKIAVLGGVQVNTPPGFTDYYLPISFDMYDNKGNFVEKIDL